METHAVEPASDAPQNAVFPSPEDPVAKLQHAFASLLDIAEGRSDDRLSMMATQNVVCRAEELAQGIDGPLVRQLLALRARAWERTMWHCFNHLEQPHGTPIGACIRDARFSLERVLEYGTLDAEVARQLEEQLDQAQALMGDPCALWKGNRTGKGSVPPDGNVRMKC